MSTPRSSSWTWAAAVFVAVGVGLAGGWFLNEAQHPPPLPPPLQAVADSLQQTHDSRTRAALDTLDASLRRTRAGLERIRPARSDEENALRRPSTSPYSRHLEMADSLGVPPVSSEGDLRRLVAGGRLVPLVDTEFYAVRILNHSAPFVTPATRRALDALGAEFAAELDRRGLPRFRPTISSITRTADSQADLRRTNRNATSGRSSHEYGTCVDVVYTRYAYLPRPTDRLRLADSTATWAPALDRLHRDALETYGGRYWQHLAGILTRVMLDAKRADRWVVLLEAEQPVFHITLAKE